MLDEFHRKRDFFFLGTSPEKLKGEKGGKEECEDCEVLCWERCSSSGVYGEGFQGDFCLSARL